MTCFLTDLKAAIFKSAKISVKFEDFFADKFGHFQFQF